MKTINEINIDNLKFLIEKYGTQANLADKIDKPATQISQWVAGYRNMSASTKRHIEEVLGLPIGWFDVSHSENGEVIYNVTICNRRNNLKKWIDEKFDGIQAQFIEATGINQGELSGLLKNKSFGEKKARNIEEAAKMPHLWLDQAHDDEANPPFSDNAILATDDSEDPEAGFIRYDVLNVTARLGDGFINSDYLEVVDTVTVSEEWAKQNLGSAYRRVQVISTKGDSMSGTIEEGDVLFVDSGVQAYQGEGIYVLHTPDGLRVKRLQRTVTGNLLVISDNPKYRDETVSGQDLEYIVICGKVKGSWSFNTF